MDSPAKMARHCRTQVQSQRVRQEVGRMAQRAQGTFLYQSGVGTRGRQDADLLGPFHRGTHSRRTWKRARITITNGTWGARPEAFPVYGPRLVRAGNLEPVSASLASGGGLLVREVAIGFRRLPPAKLRSHRKVVCGRVPGFGLPVLADLRRPGETRPDHKFVGSDDTDTSGPPTGCFARRL